jgi:hypothetical protein
MHHAPFSAASAGFSMQTIAAKTPNIKGKSLMVSSRRSAYKSL